MYRADRYRNVGELWDHAARAYADDPLLFWVRGGTTITYREMRASIGRSAALFRSLGIRKGDVVSLLVSNVPEFFHAFYGALEIGAIASTVNVFFDPPQIAAQLSHSGTKALVVEGKLLDEARAALGVAPVEIAVTIGAAGAVLAGAGRTIDLSEAPRGSDATPATPGVGPDDVAYYSYTSGTTGKPKGLVFTHRNLLAICCDQHAAIGLERGDRWLCTEQLYYQDHLIYFGYPLTVGAACVLPDAFDPRKFWRLVERYRATVSGLFPTMVADLLAQPEISPRADASSLEDVFVGGSFAMPELLERFERRFGMGLQENYGLNDAGGVVTLNPAGGAERRVGSAGRKLEYGELRIVDASGTPVGPNEIGEFVVRSPSVLREYLGDHELTARQLVDGWLHTGDNGYRDDGGYYYVVGRVGHVITKTGQGISPREIDNVLLAHPAVQDAVSVGIARENEGHVVVSFVVLKPAARASAEELGAFCRTRLDASRCPEAFRFIDRIPVSHTYKPDITQLLAFERARGDAPPAGARR